MRAMRSGRVSTTCSLQPSSSGPPKSSGPRSWSCTHVPKAPSKIRTRSRRAARKSDIRDRLLEGLTCLAGHFRTRFDARRSDRNGGPGGWPAGGKPDAVGATLCEDQDELDVVLLFGGRERHHLEVEPEFLADGDEEVEERVRLPAVEVDAVLVGHVALDVAVDLARLDARDVARPLDVVVAPAAQGALFVVAQEVLDAGQLALAVEGATLVREPEVQDPAGLEDARELQQPGDRVLQVLQQVLAITKSRELSSNALRSSALPMTSTGASSWSANSGYCRRCSWTFRRSTSRAQAS